MLTRSVSITVPGAPAPKGSMKCIGARGGRGHQLIESNAKTKPWRENVAQAAKRAPEQADKQQPVEVDITFYLERPRSHYGTGRNSDVVKPSAPTYPTSHGAGDKDKLERTVLDALQDAGMLPDDAQVVGGTTVKLYALHGQNPGVQITVHPL